MNKLDLVHCAMQAYDKRVISKEQLEKIASLDFKNGGWGKEWKEVNEVDKIQILLQLYDKGLVTNKVVAKDCFDLDVEEIPIATFDFERK